MRIEGTTPTWDYSTRGVHLIPGGYQAGWMADAAKRTFYLKLLREMHISWVLLLTTGDSCLELFDGKEVIRWFLEYSIVPVIRDSPGDRTKLPKPFMNMATVERAVAIYAEFDLVPLWKLWNEPGDHREWRHGKVPKDWWSRFVDIFNEGATIVLQLGAIPLFPDGPGYDFVEQHPFRDVDRALWDAGIGYATHNYSKGRPLHYPYVPEVLTGLPLMTERQLSKDLDDFANNIDWRAPGIEMMNIQRRAWANPEASAIQDPTCFNEWIQIDYHARRTLGYPVVQFMTEGGWVARDRAGGGPIDNRWAYTTPNKIAEQTLAMYDYQPQPYYADENGVPYPLALQAMMPWTFAGSIMGAGGFEDASWVGGSYYLEYGLMKPVIDMLIQNPPRSPCLWTQVRESFERILDS